jgi:aspartate racemase
MESVGKGLGDRVSMKTAGIIGGTGPESTVEYYRQIIATYRERNPDGSYPQIILNSIDNKKMLDLVAGNELAALTEFLVAEIEKLARAGSDFAVLAANTPHIVFDDLRRQSPIPMISIVEATCETAKALHLQRLGLFGTRFTMQGRFYPEIFSRAGITLAVPDESEQAYIHDKYMSELLQGTVLPETRERLLAIVDKMKDRDGIQAVILGGTELSLILRDPTARGIPVLDTTRIHVKAIVTELLS